MTKPPRSLRYFPLRKLARIQSSGKKAAMVRVGTAFHSLAPKGRGWGEGVTMIPYRTAGTPSSHLLPNGEKE